MSILHANAVNMMDLVIAGSPKENVATVAFSMLIGVVKLRQKTTVPSRREYLGNNMRALSTAIIAEISSSELAEIIEKFLVNYNGDKVEVYFSSLYLVSAFIIASNSEETKKKSLVLYQEQLVKCLEYFIDQGIDIITELSSEPASYPAITLFQQAIRETVEISQQFSLPELLKQIQLKDDVMVKRVLQGLNTYLSAAEAVKTSQVLSADSLFSSKEDPKNVTLAKVYQQFLSAYDGHERIYLIFALPCKTDSSVPSERLQSELSKQLGFASLAEARGALTELINKELKPRNFSSEEYINQIAMPLNQAASKGYDPLNDEEFREGYEEVMGKVITCASLEEEDGLDSESSDSLEKK